MFCEEEPNRDESDQSDDGEQRNGENVSFDGALVFQIVLQWRDDGRRDIWKMLVDSEFNAKKKCGDVAGRRCFGKVCIDEKQNALRICIRQKRILCGGVEAAEIAKCLQMMKIGEAETERIGTMVRNGRPGQRKCLADGHDGVFRRDVVKNGGIRNQWQGGDERRHDIGAFQCKTVVNGSDIPLFPNVFREFFQFWLKRQRAMKNTCI